MNLRQLQCFLVLAEERHFTRAAGRLHMEQSPLSRTIRDLEGDLDAVLFSRGPGQGTQLTPAGHALAEAVPRIFNLLEQTRSSVLAATSGFQHSLRVAISDGILPQRLAALLACCREEEPDINIRLFEVPLAEQLKGLQQDVFDIGLACSSGEASGLYAETLWQSQLVVTLPPRHPLLIHKQVPLIEVLNYPLVLFHPQVQAGLHEQIAALLSTVETAPKVAERATSQEMLLSLVAAGYAVGLSCSAQLATRSTPSIVTRPLAGEPAPLTTYLLRSQCEPKPPLSRFIARARNMAAHYI